MAEEVTKYVVSIGFDDAIRNVNKFINKMSRMEQGREAALSRQIRLQRQLNSLRMASNGGGGGVGQPLGTGSGGGGNRGSTANPNIGPARPNMTSQSTSPMVGPSRNAEAEAMNARLRAADRLQNSLDTQLRSARRVVNVMNEEEDVATRTAAASIRTRIATAATADEVRDIVAQERARLRISRRTTAQSERQNFLLRRMRSSSEQVAGNMASAFAVGAAGAFITKTGQDFESVNNTMLAVSENSKEAGENFEFVREEAFRLGAGLTQSAKGFAKLRAAQGEMSLEDTRALFSGTSEMGSLLGLTAEESGRALSAIQQIKRSGFTEM